MRAIVAGAVTNLATLAHADLRVTLEGRDLAELFPLLPVPLPKTKPYRVEGALLRDAERWQFREFAGRVGKSDLSERSRSRTRHRAEGSHGLTGEVRSERLDLTDLSGLLGEDPRPEKAGREGRNAGFTATPTGASTARRRQRRLSRALQAVRPRR